MVIQGLGVIIPGIAGFCVLDANVESDYDFAERGPGVIARRRYCTEDYGGIARTPFVGTNAPRCVPSATATHDNGCNVRDLGPLSDMFD